MFEFHLEFSVLAANLWLAVDVSVMNKSVVNERAVMMEKITKQLQTNLNLFFFARSALSLDAVKDLFLLSSFGSPTFRIKIDKNMPRM